MGWQISGDELEGSELTSLTLTDTDTGWSTTRVLSADQMARLGAQVEAAQAHTERTGEKVTFDLSLVFPDGGDAPGASTQD